MEDARKKQKFVADFNGDGYDDIQLIDLESSGSNMTKPMVFLGDGRGGFNRQDAGANVYALDKWHFYTGDFNGDGKEDFICTSDWNKSNWDGYQLFLMPNGHNNLLNKIVDGLGNETNIEYKYLSDNDVFECGNSSKYPVASVGLSYPIVSTIKTPNGIGGTKKIVINIPMPFFIWTAGDFWALRLLPLMTSQPVQVLLQNTNLIL